MRCGAIIAAVAAIAAMQPHLALAKSADQQLARQRDVDRYLSADMPIKKVAGVRMSCASGQMPQAIRRERSAGMQDSADAADVCVTAAIRLGREGQLVKLTAPVQTPALAFDTGFVTAYQKKLPLDPRAPAMTALKGIAERCFDQAEKDTNLCFSAGYAFGARAVNGETVVVQ